MPFGTPRSACSSLCVGTAIGWIAVLAGWSDILEPSAVSRVARAARAAPADPRRRVLHGLRDIAPLLATAIPLGVYNFTEA